MAYRPSRKRKATQVQIEPSITPIMNLMVVLIPLLLGVTQYVGISLLEYEPPIAQDITELGEGNDEGKEYLGLVLNVLDNGFEISMFGETSGHNYRFIPLLNNVHDYNRLQGELVRIKNETIGVPLDTLIDVDPATGRTYNKYIYKFEDAETVSIAAKGNTNWQLIVKVMDLTREYKSSDGRFLPLFPNPHLGQIQ